LLIVTPYRSPSSQDKFEVSIMACKRTISHASLNPTNLATAKHFHNDPNHLVVAALRSLTKINPSVAVDEKHKIVYLKKPKSNQVSVISGGGSGHEPAFAAYVGHGMLSGAVAGSIFASPSTVQIYQCLMRRVDNTQGVMVIVMNYTGDALHFGMAVEKCRAQGIKIDMLVVGDDVGVGRAKSGRLGRRGIAGTVLVHKIACALAATGYVVCLFLGSGNC
jgi:dihydroxyacetone kinase